MSDQTESSASAIAAATTDAAGKTNHVKVILVEPLQRASGQIESLTLRKPKAGEMRGLKVEELFGSDVNAVLALLPRITDPFITIEEAGELSSEDLGEIAGAVKGFFMTPAHKAMIAKMLEGSA